ncbi:YraN family protein [Donghicola sp. XS_ASV15]|uniref:YraN family protein n=1 Tax=Donghicola sp. XS_ASV15 TaxID=3241295 RepID=UPI003519AD0A
MSGQKSYLAGFAAEESVALKYQSAGHRILARRWRGKSGEIDIVAEGPTGLIFVEVKSSKTHARAAASLSVRQQNRLRRAAEEFAAQRHGRTNIDMRVDVALMDQVGRIEILENALLAA